MTTNKYYLSEYIYSRQKMTLEKIQMSTPEYKQKRLRFLLSKTFHRKRELRDENFMILFNVTWVWTK